MITSDPAVTQRSPFQALRAIAALLVFWGHAINAVHQKNRSRLSAFI